MAERTINLTWHSFTTKHSFKARCIETQLLLVSNCNVTLRGVFLPVWSYGSLLTFHKRSDLVLPKTATQGVDVKVSWLTYDGFALGQRTSSADSSTLCCLGGSVCLLSEFNSVPHAVMTEGRWAWRIFLCAFPKDPPQSPSESGHRKFTPSAGGNDLWPAKAGSSKLNIWT